MRYFLEVVRCGSITEAARRLNVVPSAISKQIGQLEAGLNTRLFERYSRGMIPNAAGELLAKYAFRNQLETERVNSEILELQGLKQGEVRLACNVGFAFELVPRAVVKFRQVHPGIHFHLREMLSREITSMLCKGEVDIGLAFSQIPEARLKVEYRDSTPIMAIMHRQHPLAAEPSLTLAQLARQELGLPSPGIRTRLALEACCARQGLVLNTVFSSNSLAPLLAFAHSEGGIVIGFAQLLHDYLARNDMVAVRLRSRRLLPMNVELQTLAGRVLPQAVIAFLETIQAELLASCQSACPSGALTPPAR